MLKSRVEIKVFMRLFLRVSGAFFRRGMLDNTGAFRYNTGIVNILRFFCPFLGKRLLGMVATEISGAVFFTEKQHGFERK